MRILNIFGVTARRFIRSNMHDAYKYVKEYNPNISIEPHFNAIENEDINGTICLYENENSKKVAGFFLNTISDDLNTKKLYIKKLNSFDYGYKNLSSFTFPSIITESFFGTSKKDCEKVTYELLALTHVNAIMKFLKKYKQE